MQNKRVTIIACEVMQLEIEALLEKMEWQPEVLYLDSAMHIYPAKMRTALIDHINELASQVDVVFLGYGFCQSLEGIEEECSIPVILPQVDDCFSLLLSPEKYSAEIKKEAGTWFMSPGWATVSREMVIKELHLERVKKYGKDPMVMAKRLFNHYKRCLYIDTGVGDSTANIAAAQDFSNDFGLELETTKAEPHLLEFWLHKAYAIAFGKDEEYLKP